MAGDKSQRTEKPTAKKKREAREQGQVATTPDLVTWIGLLVTTVLLQTTVDEGVKRFPAMLTDMAAIISDPSQESAMKFTMRSLLAGALIAAPLVLGLVLTSIVVSLGQVGLKPAWKKLKPDFKHLSLLKGMKRLVSPQAWWELAKATAKVAILALIAYPTVAHLMTTLASGGSLQDIVALTAKTSLSLMRNVAGIGLVIAAVDYAVARRRINKQIMMTKQEVLDEYKQQEGDPKVRQAIRSRQQSMGRNKMMRMVASADVVVVNPTHFAVALRYDPVKGAPEVLAKGADHLALRIRLEATKAGVPIVHEPTTARALYKVCEVGGVIPIEMYEAVAHILAFIFSLRALGRADGYHEFGRELIDA